MGQLGPALLGAIGLGILSIVAAVVVPLSVLAARDRAGSELEPFPSPTPVLAGTRQGQAALSIPQITPHAGTALATATAAQATATAAQATATAAQATATAAEATATAAQATVNALPSTPTPKPPTATPGPGSEEPTPIPVTATPTAAIVPTSTPEPTTGPSGDPVAGSQVFESAGPIACNVCHSLDGTVGLGPSLQGIASGAGNRAPGLSAEEYIRQSILDPGAYEVGGFPSGLMPITFGTDLTPQQIEDVIAFLLTQ